VYPSILDVVSHFAMKLSKDVGVVSSSPKDDGFDGLDEVEECDVAVLAAVLSSGSDGKTTTPRNTPNNPIVHIPSNMAHGESYRNVEERQRQRRQQQRRHNRVNHRLTAFLLRLPEMCRSS